jgi:hypothetical protein
MSVAERTEAVHKTLVLGYDDRGKEEHSETSREERLANDDPATESSSDGSRSDRTRMRAR